MRYCWTWSILSTLAWYFVSLSVLLLAYEKSLCWWRLARVSAAGPILLWWAAAGGLCAGISHPEAQQHPAPVVKVWRQQLHQTASAQPEHEKQPSPAAAKGRPGDCCPGATDWLPWRWQALQAGGVWRKPPGNWAGAGKRRRGEKGGWIYSSKPVGLCDAVFWQFTFCCLPSPHDNPCGRHGNKEMSLFL